jgi:hypothetical protein
MKKQTKVLLVLAIAFIACHKEHNPDPAIVPPPPPPPAPTFLLKEIQIQNLPSPYYHFEYNATGQVTLALFASGFDNYNVSYKNSRISEMKNAGVENNDKLEYAYDNLGRINMVTYISDVGNTRGRVLLSYDGQKLATLTRQLNINSDFVTDKVMTFSYYPDGNLLELSQHRFAVAGQNDVTYSDKYEQYDNKINTDGFQLIHDDFFDHLVLLPGVQLQKNNPGKVTHTGDVDNFKVEYSYTYNDKNLPVSRVDDFTILTGNDAGRVFQSGATYSYY